MKTPEEKGVFDLIEEAMHLLRVAPVQAHLSYYVGSLPFVLGVLYFWSDMGRSAFAFERLPLASLGMALLFLWMKCWQCVFAQRLLARLLDEPAARWTPRRVARMASVQALWQAPGLFLLPFAFLLLIPFGWAYAFHQNVTVLGNGGEDDARTIFKRAVQQAKLWPRQNHLALLILKLFGLFVFINLITAVLAGPFLLKTLLGIETPFMQSWRTIANTTFFASMLGLAYLCLDPLFKTVYVLRCFYGESLQTGQDLKAELTRYLSGGRLAMAALLLLLWAGPTAIGAERTEGDHGTPAPAIAPPALDRTIEDVISQREYAWRLPRERARPESERGFLAAVSEMIRDAAESAGKTFRRWFRKVGDWIEKFFRPKGSGLGGGSWISTVHGLIFVLLAVLLCLIVFLLFRLWKRFRSEEPDVAAEAVQPAPDLANENVGADQLPESGWLKLARELLERGELRLALRAFYLASLAHLAGRNLVTLAKFKSNRDYERELRRRSHALPELAQLFGQNVAVFDRIWYGLHEVNPEVVDRFARNVQSINAA